MRWSFSGSTAACRGRRARGRVRGRPVRRPEPERYASPVPRRQSTCGRWWAGSSRPRRPSRRTRGGCCTGTGSSGTAAAAGRSRRPAGAGTCGPAAGADCGRSFFPRIEPAVIVLVEAPGPPARCLLARHGGAPEGAFSTLAGFVEVGESLEDAVRREMAEEAGRDRHRPDLPGVAGVAVPGRPDGRLPGRRHRPRRSASTASSCWRRAGSPGTSCGSGWPPAARWAGSTRSTTGCSTTGSPRGSDTRRPVGRRRP